MSSNCPVTSMLIRLSPGLTPPHALISRSKELQRLIGIKCPKTKQSFDNGNSRLSTAGEKCDELCTHRHTGLTCGRPIKRCLFASLKGMASSKRACELPSVLAKRLTCVVSDLIALCNDGTERRRNGPRVLKLY